MIQPLILIFRIPASFGIVVRCPSSFVIRFQRTRDKGPRTKRKIMLFEPLFAHATQKPQEIAVIDDSGQYTWQQLAAMATGLGMYLAAQTQKPRVGLLLPSSAGFAAS